MEGRQRHIFSPDLSHTAFTQNSRSLSDPWFETKGIFMGGALPEPQLLKYFCGILTLLRPAGRQLSDEVDPTSYLSSDACVQ